jgi:ribonuclease inhibitor
MPVKRCVLDGREIRSLSALYDAIGQQLQLPEYFGRNLDALADVLLTDVEGPLEIVWEHAIRSKEFLQEDFVQIKKMLDYVASNRDDVRVVFSD